MSAVRGVREERRGEERGEERSGVRRWERWRDGEGEKMEEAANCVDKSSGAHRTQTCMHVAHTLRAKTILSLH